MTKLIMTLCFAAMAVMPAYAAEQIENFTAKLFTTKGTVEVLKMDTADWLAVKAPYMLEVGDQVRTGRKSKAEIYIKYGSKIRLQADTTFKVGKVSHEENAVEIVKGRMQAWIRKFAGRAFTVRTPAAVCAVRGTVLGVEVTEAGESTWDLFSGAMQVSDNQNRTVDLLPGQRVAVSQAPAAPPPAAQAIPLAVKPPAEPAKIKEEKIEIKAEAVIVKAQQAEAAKAQDAAKPAPKPVPVPADEKVITPVIQEPVTNVIPTETVQEAEEVSGSTP
jgi:hypothetical protein